MLAKQLLFDICVCKVTVKEGEKERCVWKQSSSCIQKKTHGSFQPGLYHLAPIWMVELKASCSMCLLAGGWKKPWGKAGNGVNANGRITLAAMLGCTNFLSSHAPPISAGKLKRGCRIRSFCFSSPYGLFGTTVSAGPSSLVTVEMQRVSSSLT